MGLLDQVLGGVLGQMGGQSAQPQQGNALLAMAMQLLQNYPGGLQGLLAQFAKAGMGQQAQSWVGTGQNMPISAEDLMKVLGQGQLQAIGQQHGLAPQDMAGGLAGLLPAIIDHMTPGGQVPEDGATDMDQLLAGLQGKLTG